MDLEGFNLLQMTLLIYYREDVCLSLSPPFSYHFLKLVFPPVCLCGTEAFRAPMFRNGPDKNGFSLGCSKNLREVFGDEKKYWLLPVFTRYYYLNSVFSASKKCKKSKM